MALDQTVLKLQRMNKIPNVFENEDKDNCDLAEVLRQLFTVDL